MNELSAAWLLHSRPYKERSVIAEFLVEGHGRVAMVVRGVRQAKSRTAPLLQPFTQVLLSWRGRGELKTLDSIELSRSVRLAGQSLYCGFYVNELVLRATVPGQTLDGLTDLYGLVIAKLQEDIPVAPVLRLFELELLGLTGYLPSLSIEQATSEAVTEHNYYRFLPEHGLVRLTPEMPVKADCFSGTALLALASRDFSQSGCYSEFKRFTRIAMMPLIGTKPLRSRELFSKVSTTTN